MQEYKNIFDTHAHYDAEQFDGDRDEVLARLPGQGVRAVMNAACDMKSCYSSLELTRKYDYIYCAVGIHPQAVDEFKPRDIEAIAALAQQKKVLAIGEIGLDYHYEPDSRERQIALFTRQLELAADLSLPVIIHDREAHGDMMELLKKYRPKGIMHCFSGSAEMAAEILKLGMYIGFGGAVTFHNARRILNAAQSVPLDRLLVETDAPYMAPVPMRGKRCDSSLIPYAAQTLAQLHGVGVQELLDCTCENAAAVYSAW